MTEFLICLALSWGIVIICFLINSIKEHSNFFEGISDFIKEYIGTTIPMLIIYAVIALVFFCFIFSYYVKSH